MSSDLQSFHLWLLRHGNTFASSDRAVWLGKDDDPPMVASGIAQIWNVSKYFRDIHLTPCAAYCAPYCRVSQSVQILRQTLPDFPAHDDPRLCELDYGDWNGLTNEEIRERYGPEKIEAWRNYGVFPTAMGWRPSQEELKRDAITLLAEILARHGSIEQSVLVVAPNSRLRYFLQAVKGAVQTISDKEDISIHTGNFGRLVYRSGAWHVAEWNRDPPIKRAR